MIDLIDHLFGAFSPNNLSDAQFRAVLIAWLVIARTRALKGGASIQIPILALVGEPGSAKTTVARHLLRIVAGEAEDVLAPPRTLDEFVLAASGVPAIAIDNLSPPVPPYISDALCRATTGSAFKKKKLYADTDVVRVNARAAVIVTSLEPVLVRGDAQDRTFTIWFARLGGYRSAQRLELRAAPVRKRLAREVERVAKAALSEYLRAPDLSTPHRLADFALLGALALDRVDSAGGLSTAFDSVLSGIADAQIDAWCAADPLNAALLDLAREQPKGKPPAFFTACDLLEELGERIGSSGPPRTIDPQRAGVAIRELSYRAARFVRLVPTRRTRKRGFHVELVS